MKNPNDNRNRASLPPHPFRDDDLELTKEEVLMMRNLRARRKELSQDSDQIGFAFGFDEGYTGFTTIENYMFDIKGLSANKKMLLMMMWRYAGRKEQQYDVFAYPSIKTLMSTCGVKSKNTVLKAIRFYEWLGWITKREQYNKLGDNMSNLYTIRHNLIQSTLKIFNTIGLEMDVVEDYFETLNKIDSDILTENTCIFLHHDYKLGDEKPLLEAALEEAKRKKERAKSK